MNEVTMKPELNSSIIRKVKWIKTNGINNVVVIPAIAEFDNIKTLLQSLLQLDNFYLDETLFLFVINNSDQADLNIREDNSNSLNFLREVIFKEPVNSFSQKIIDSKLNLALIDASSSGEEIPYKIAGVGAARKTGMDLALSLFDHSTSSKKIIICLDADCLVEKNYLKAIKESFEKDDIDVAVIDYQHQINEDVNNTEAITWYEIFLRYYSLGLAYAGSPYSFHTIGSTIVCTDKAYKKAGGMNIKEAAEDFYFLQKLAKQFPVYRIFNTKVYPSARESWRVPFGTGRSITDFINSTKKDLLLYDPNIFEILKNWLGFFNESGFEPADFILMKANSIHPGLSEFLKQRKFENSWQNILSNSKSIRQLSRHKKDWFDAFKTLKLVHYLRDNHFPLINMYDSLDYFVEKLGFPVIVHSESKTDIEIQKEYLFFLKEAEKKLLIQNDKKVVIN
jgi:Glycosyl transferase family 2